VGWLGRRLGVWGLGGMLLGWVLGLGGVVKRESVAVRMEYCALAEELESVRVVLSSWRPS